MTVDKILESVKITRVQNQYIMDKADGIRESLVELTDSITKNNEQLTTISIALGITLGVMTILTVVILWNQRKIKKMLRELQEQKNEDKP